VVIDATWKQAGTRMTPFIFPFNLFYFQSKMGFLSPSNQGKRDEVAGRVSRPRQRLPRREWQVNVRTGAKFEKRSPSRLLALEWKTSSAIRFMHKMFLRSLLRYTLLYLRIYFQSGPYRGRIVWGFLMEKNAKKEKMP
jgi:hypothetical protein